MQYSYSYDKASAFSSQALKRIEEENLKPVPSNFELWFVYYSSENTDIVRAIDLMVEGGETIEDEHCEALYQRFLSPYKDNERVRQAGQRIQETIREMSGHVTGVKSVAESYARTLEDATKTLSKDNDPLQIRQTLDAVLNNTQDMIQHNINLEEELERSSIMMQELQRDLKRVRKQALTDGLTDIANRKAFDREMSDIISKTDKEGGTFTLIFIDIDHFKNFNDTYGHQVGDQVLRLVAKTLIDGIKGRDFAARYGGEEFAIILPDTDLSSGLKVADSLRKILESKELVNRNTGKTLGRITLSGGVAEYVEEEGADSLIERVDTALYTAKHNGRNQISAANKKR